MKKNLRSILMFMTAGLLLCPAGSLLAEQMPPPPPQKKGEKRAERLRHPGKRSVERRRFPWADLLANLPVAEQTRLKKLAQENPASFRKEIFKLMEARRKKQFDELLALRKAYLNAPAGAEKEKAKNALRKRIEDDMKRHSARAERRIRMMEKQLEHFQKRVNAARKQHEKMKAGQGAIVEKILKDFTDPAKEPGLHPPRKKKK